MQPAKFGQLNGRDSESHAIITRHIENKIGRIHNAETAFPVPRELVGICKKISRKKPPVHVQQSVGNSSLGMLGGGSLPNYPNTR